VNVGVLQMLCRPLPQRSYHTAGVKWNVFIRNICGVCWLQH
jgi:hypothetical protein